MPQLTHDLCRVREILHHDRLKTGRTPLVSKRCLDLPELLPRQLEALSRQQHECAMLLRVIGQRDVQPPPQVGIAIGGPDDDQCASLHRIAQEAELSSFRITYQLVEVGESQDDASDVVGADYSMQVVNHVGHIRARTIDTRLHATWVIHRHRITDINETALRSRGDSRPCVGAHAPAEGSEPCEQIHPEERDGEPEQARGAIDSGGRDDPQRRQER